MPSLLLITGATAYLSSNFLNYVSPDFFSQWNSIILSDRSLKTHRLKDSLQEHCIQIDLDKELDKLEQLISKYSSVYCIHSARCNKELEFLDLISRNPRNHIVYFSSAAVYGELREPDDLRAISETEQPFPLSDYGRAKLNSENFITRAFQSYLILRIANPYGKEFENKSVVSIFRENLQHKKTLDINADRAGQIYRDFIYIDDVSESIALLIQKGAEGILNISSGEALSLEDLAQRLAPGRELSFNYKTKAKTDIAFSRLDNTRLRNYGKMCFNFNVYEN